MNEYSLEYCSGIMRQGPEPSFRLNDAELPVFVSELIVTHENAVVGCLTDAEQWKFTKLQKLGFRLGSGLLVGLWVAAAVAVIQQ